MRCRWTWSLLSLALTACAARHAPTNPPAIEGPQLVVLGTAQDAGVPQAACVSENCEAARADPTRRALATSLALVLGDGDTYLFEATPDIREQLDMSIALSRAAGGTPSPRVPVAGVFLTHAHMGHYLGLAHFGFEAAHTDHLPVFCSPSMATFLAENAPWSQLVQLEEIELRPLERSVDVGGVSVQGIAVPHRAEFTDTVAYRIAGPHRTVLFVPDTDPWRRWPAPPLDLFEGIDVALIDGTFASPAELPGRDLEQIGHPFIVDSMELLQSRVEAGMEVVFIHLNHSNAALRPDSTMRRTIEARGFSVAVRGQHIAL